MTPSPPRTPEVAPSRKKKKSMKPTYVEKKRAASSAAPSSSMAAGSEALAGPSTAASSAGPSAASSSAAGSSFAGPSSAAPPAAPPAPGSSTGGLSALAPSFAGLSLAGSSSAGPSLGGLSAAAPPFLGLSAAAPSSSGPSSAGPSSSDPSSSNPTSSSGKKVSSMDPARLAQAQKTASIIRAHDEGRLNLWGTGISHDIVVECRGHTWKCHHDILAREVKWFGEHGGWDDDREGRVVTCEMNNHDPIRLGYCLRFMYEKEYDFGYFDPEDPLSVNNFRTQVFMYNCGSSIGYQNLMDYAVRNLYQYGRELPQALATLPPAANHLPAGFVNELKVTLSETLGHTENPLIFLALRTAMASIMESLIPWLRQHPGFCAATKGVKVWDTLLAQVDADIKQMNELGHVYGPDA